MREPVALTFEKNYLTIPEIVEKFAQTYHITIRNADNGKRKKGRVNSTYRTIYQHIKRDLDAAVDRGEGGVKACIKAGEKKRGDRYSRELVYLVVNNTSLKGLMYMADKAKQKAREMWTERAQEVMQQYEALRQAGAFEPEQEPPLTLTMEGNRIVHDEKWEKSATLSQRGIEIALEDELKKKKYEIMMDYIFRCCIDLDEELLKCDISAEFTYDPTDDAEGEKLEAIERLSNLQSYYSIRKKGKKEDGGQV